MNLLISYEHSGDFWVRYMVEYCTKLPTLGPEENDKPIGELYPLSVDLEGQPVLISKRNFSKEDKDDKNKALFIIRNYRDVFVRKSFEKNEVQGSFYEKTYLDEGYDKYMSVLRDYDEFSGDKFLVYYEDLVSDPGTWIKKIFKFLGISDIQADFFIKEYEKHYRCSLGIFRRNYPGSDLTAFPESLAYDIKIHMNDIMMYNSPLLFGKYLTRYTD